ncbi:MAG TPA: hemerythrin domain-containing protein [Polyangiaceae bacterium]|nr:hemerythrin domain-containing protein [Polyangiaceae bacterium]
MSALLSLTEEHETISGLLGALQTHATRMHSGASVDPADLARFSEVLHELVDYRHHEKEEGILMPLLARNGFEWSRGLLAELRHEHGHLRHLIDVLSQAAAKDLGGSREQRRQVVEVALAFVEYKRRHIAKEEDVLLPALLERLDARALEQLTAELERFDRAGRESKAPLEQLTFELVTRYSEDSGMVDVTGLRWTEAAELAGRGRRVTSFGRSR